MTVLLLPDRSLQGHRLLADLQDLTHPVHRHVHLLCNLLRGWLPAQFLEKLAADADQLIDGLHHMDRDPDGPGLVGDGPGDGLTDPPGGIGREFEALAVVKFLHSLDQPQVPLLNQIQEQHSAAHIALGNADHQTQVRLCQTLFGLFISQFQPLGQVDLLLSGEQGHLADLFQIHAHRVLNADVVRNGQIQVLHIHFILFREDDLFIVYIIFRDPQYIHIILVQNLQDLLKLFLLQRQVREELADLLVFQHVLLLFGHI